MSSQPPHSHHHGAHDSGDRDDSHSHSHGHSHSDESTPAIQSQIYDAISFDLITTLNESEAGSGREIVAKPFAAHLEPEPSLVSNEDDPQLLLTVPFGGSVKLHSLLLRGSDSASSPQTLQLFLNRDGLDFSSAADLAPTQTLVLPRSNALLDLPLKRALWNSTRAITLFVVDNHATPSASSGTDDEAEPEAEAEAERTQIFYLGFKGQVVSLNREPVSFLYEVAANPADHAVKGVGVNRAGLGMGRGGDAM